MALRLGEWARGWETPAAPNGQTQGTWTYVHATIRAKVPVTETASQARDSCPL